MNFLDDRLPILYWNKLAPCPMTGCWLWTGYLTKQGYGVHGRSAPHSQSKLTHRYAYETAIGALPHGTELDHRVCQTRSCANPAHLEAVSHRVNVQRGKVKKTHCKRGHELAGENLMLIRRGTRCMACVNMAAKERHRATYVTKARKPPARKPNCKYGHPKVDNGKRMICPTCIRTRGAASSTRPVVGRVVRSSDSMGSMDPR